MKYVKSKIIPLPAIKENYPFIGIYHDNGRGSLTFVNGNRNNSGLIEPYNLYFLSDEEIKAGDVVLHDFGMGFEIENPCDIDNLKSNTRFKIIATTDEKLNKLGIARPSDKFLKSIVSLGVLGKLWLNMSIIMTTPYHILKQ